MVIEPMETSGASGKPWAVDAVIDTSAGELPPRQFCGARALEPVTCQYVYISTASVYADGPTSRFAR
ncbi:hypothetical protein E6W39_00005 [Kitasatospora acidiphila]|uniref:Uncharacterized protein n=1 Tax=Kitasatospora acidiphila TaxID=2567942 RepID=A0A540WG81_9ACTN|nr:hypothetical protein [Kitasatospora acidiphila]TQF07992.1 hypothetical protein E6W39_00005 [Kitasatospora acidiphila]